MLLHNVYLLVGYRLSTLMLTKKLLVIAASDMTFGGGVLYTRHKCDRRWLFTESWWRHQIETLSALLAICVGNSPVNSPPHKGQWRGALMFSLICGCIHGWVNNHEAGNLRRHRAHYDVTVMWRRCWSQLIKAPLPTSGMRSARIGMSKFTNRIKPG